MRLASEVSRHAGNAAAAASITARASSTLARATSPVTSPVAGLVTGAVPLLVPANGVVVHPVGDGGWSWSGPFLYFATYSVMVFSW